MNSCVTCSGTLSGRQTKFCSRRCKNKHTNSKHQSYYAQQARGFERKKALVDLKGGQCQRCGYDANYSALEFHHRNSDQKKFNLDLRALSNRCCTSIVTEVAKCQLVCSNCHREIHFPSNRRREKSRAVPGFSSPAGAGSYCVSLRSGSS